MKTIEITDTSKDLFPGSKTAAVSEIEAMLNSHRNVTIWRQKVDKFQRKIDTAQNEFNSKIIPDFDLFKIEFPRGITGQIYADYILNEEVPITQSQAAGINVLFKKLKCFLRFSQDIKEFPEIYVSILLENLQTPSYHFEKLIIYEIEVSHLFIDWVSEHDSDKKGFANFSCNLPLIGRALIFNDDNIREDTNSAIENILKKIEQKYGYATGPIYWTEEQIRSARGETAPHYIQELPPEIFLTED